MSFFSYKSNMRCESKMKYPHVVVTGSCGNIPERLIVCQPFLWIAKGFRTEQNSEVLNSGPSQTTDVCGRMIGKLKVEAYTLSPWWTLHKQGPASRVDAVSNSKFNCISVPEWKKIQLNSHHGKHFFLDYLFWHWDASEFTDAEMRWAYCYHVWRRTEMRCKKGKREGPDLAPVT